MLNIPGRSNGSRRALCALATLILTTGIAAPDNVNAAPPHTPIRHAAYGASHVPPEIPAPRLSYSDEFDRAELIERMLEQCRGIPYNAYELAQTSGEALWLPAPIQLVVVRVRHPYCRDLLRGYAPRTAV
ncbi:MAG: hypothetical protein ACREYB_04845 [Casimicrobiaceae bacterium]